MQTILQSKLFFMNAQVGQLTQARLRRTTAIYGAVALLGLMLFLGGFGKAVDAFALGLIWPGGGFFANACITFAPLLGLGAFLIFALSVVA